MSFGKKGLENIFFSNYPINYFKTKYLKKALRKVFSNHGRISNPSYPKNIHLLELG
jgi:hypothetical protein